MGRGVNRKAVLERQIRRLEKWLEDESTPVEQRGMFSRSLIQSVEELGRIQASEDAESRSKAGKKPAKRGQVAPLTESEPEESMHPECEADRFYQRVEAEYVKALLAGRSAALTPEEEEFRLAYEEAVRREQIGEPWEPPELPSPLPADDSDSKSGDESVSGDVAVSEPEPASENAPTGTTAAQESPSEDSAESSGGPSKEESSPSQTAGPEPIPENGQPESISDRSARAYEVELSDGRRAFVPSIMPSDWSPEREWEISMYQEEQKRKREERERLGMANPLNL